MTTKEEQERIFSKSLADRVLDLERKVERLETSLKDYADWFYNKANKTQSFGD